MIRALTRRKKQDGSQFTRPAAIEMAIEAALLLERTEVLRRAELDWQAPQSLKLETVVHLARNAVRSNEIDFAQGLLQILLKRCETALNGMLRGSAHADDIRQSVIDHLVDKFIEEFRAVAASASLPDELDIYEASFLKTIGLRKIDAQRKQSRLNKKNVSLPDNDSDEDESRRSDPSSDAGQEAVVEFGRHLDVVMSFPVAEREAFLLVHIRGHKIESTIEDEETAATIAGVSGRTIRARLKKCAELLKRHEEKKP